MSIMLLSVTLPVWSEYTITWHTLEPGSTSSNANYSLQGVIGQPDAFVQAGGPYILSGGFLPGMNYCRVDMNDLISLTANWLENGSIDFNGSEPVDIIDFDLMSTLWLYPCPGNWPIP